MRICDYIMMDDISRMRDFGFVDNIRANGWEENESRRHWSESTEGTA